jgi:hypothetical protein
MKLTRELRKEINAAVRANVRGANPLAEVGYRQPRDIGEDGPHDDWTSNALMWTANGDLGDLYRLADIKTIEDDPANPGCAELDLYVTTGVGNGRELETNVGVLIRDGHVVAASDSGIRLDALRAEINFPATRGW